MAKKKIKKDSASSFKKGVTLIAAVLTFIFMFLEILAVNTKVTLFGNDGEVNSKGIKLTELLFNEEHELIREELSTTTTVLWVALICVALAVVVSLLAFVARKGSSLSKFAGVLLVVGMLVLFVTNFDKASGGIGGLFTGETWISNITTLYFIALASSVIGLGSALTLKK